MRRAAVSVSSNIAEGAGRHSNKEFIQFLYIALGSVQEIDTQLLISLNLEFIAKSDYDALISKLNQISKMLFGLIKSIKQKLN